MLSSNKLLQTEAGKGPKLRPKSNPSYQQCYAYLKYMQSYFSRLTYLKPKLKPGYIHQHTNTNLFIFYGVIVQKQKCWDMRITQAERKKIYRMYTYLV
jgi:hypothetical protein